MKRTIVSILLLVILGGLVFLLRKKLGSKETALTPVAEQQPSTVEQLLETPETSNTGTSTEVSIDNLEGYDYEGGGDYKQFFPQTVKDALSAKKKIVLFFYANWDPSDKALDLDLQKRKDRIPKNMLILRVDYDSNEKLRTSFDIKNQNTLVWLNDQGTEITRRSIGITSLSQIVRVTP